MIAPDAVLRWLFDGGILKAIIFIQGIVMVETPWLPPKLGLMFEFLRKPMQCKYIQLFQFYCGTPLPVTKLAVGMMSHRFFHDVVCEVTTHFEPIGEYPYNGNTFSEK